MPFCFSLLMTVAFGGGVFNVAMVDSDWRSGVWRSIDACWRWLFSRYASGVMGIGTFDG